MHARDVMTEESNTEAPPGDTADPVVPTVEPVGSAVQDTETASPWPMRASPYV